MRAVPRENGAQTARPVWTVRTVRRVLKAIRDPKAPLVQLARRVPMAKMAHLGLKVTTV